MIVKNKRMNAAKLNVGNKLLIIEKLHPPSPSPSSSSSSTSSPSPSKSSSSSPSRSSSSSPSPFSSSSASSWFAPLVFCFLESTSSSSAALFRFFISSAEGASATTSFLTCASDILCGCVEISLVLFGSQTSTNYPM